MTYTFARDGAPQIDARNNIYYMAAGNSPAMMEKNVGQGSQYLWTYRDRDGNYLDGARNYLLHIGPQIPAKNFWSVVVYDALSRSELQNGQALPSVSVYSEPKVNEDGSVDIFFGPDEPKSKGNWIETVPGKGWFPIFRFYGPTAAVALCSGQSVESLRCPRPAMSGRSRPRASIIKMCVAYCQRRAVSLSESRISTCPLGSLQHILRWHSPRMESPVLRAPTLLDCLHR